MSEVVSEVVSECVSVLSIYYVSIYVYVCI